MRIFSNKFGQMCAGLAVAASIGIAAAPVKADTIQLGFILDRSGSIGPGNWTVIVNGLSAAIGNIPVGGDDTYEVSVVTFASSATANISNFLVTDATSRSNLQTQIAGLTSVYSGGLTDYAAAFTTMTAALGGTNQQDVSFSYVNFATDGDPTDGGSGGVSHNQAGINARNAMITAGVDNISIEGIGSGVSAANLINNYCSPQPCDTVSPYDFPTQGFYIGVSDAAGYAAAIGNKVRIVTGQVPEPQMIALLGIGLLGLTPLMRRRRQD